MDPESYVRSHPQMIMPFLCENLFINNFKCVGDIPYTILSYKYKLVVVFNLHLG